MEIVGNLLIAPPVVKNNFWHKTVILVTEHHSQGSLGIVLNKPSKISITEFGEQLDITLNIPGYVYVGGPIHNHSLSMIHTSEWSCKNTLVIDDEFSLSSADDILPRLAVGDCPLQWRLFMGMCGWGNGQLINEIKGQGAYKHENSWCVAKPTINLVFDTDGPDQWCNALDRSGLEFAQNMLS